MKDTFEDVYKNIGIALAHLPYWNIDGIVDVVEGDRAMNVKIFGGCYRKYIDEDKYNGFIYLPYNNKYIKVFFYE